MDVPANHFKRAIKSGRSQIGLWCSLASNISVEIVAGSGFDWLLLDTEHSPNELPMVYSQLQAVMENRVQPIVRPPWNDQVMIKRFLDAGVQTLLVPMIQTVEEAEQAVASTRYPPRGVRGFASASRSSRFGRVKDYHTRCEEEICVLVQIETRLGLDNLEAIAGVEGVDGVFIGPGDLSAGLGYLGDQGNPAMVAVYDDAIAPDQGCRQGAGLPDRRRGVGPALHRAGLPVHRRGRRFRHPGARLGAARGQVQEFAARLSAVRVARRAAGRLVSACQGRAAHAEIRGQSHHALQRARFPRPLRGGRRRRLRGRRVPVPLSLRQGGAGGRG